jgi:hypothetical protein
VDATFDISRPAGVFRKVSGVMTRATSLDSAGLDVVLTKEPSGTWHAAARHNGREVFSKAGYKTDASARGGVSYWFQHHYRKEMLRQDLTPPVADGSAAGLGRSIREKANAAEAESVVLRTRADKLEADAKRMHAAADLLEDPDGH